MAEAIIEEKKEIALDEKPSVEESLKNNKEEIAEKEEGKTENKDEEKNGTDEEDNDESSEEELGELEKPIEILTTKRSRKSVERLALKESSDKKAIPEDDYDYTKGKGVKLGDIPYIKHMIDNTLADDLKPMHRLLFNKVGKANMVKKNIRAFCGYPFKKDTVCYQRVDTLCSKFVNAGLKFVCGILGLEKSGEREALKERLMQFLLLPVDSEKPLPGSSKKKKTPSKKKSKTPKKKTASKKTDKGEDDEEDDEEKASPAKKSKKSKTMSVKLPAPKKKTPKKRESKRVAPSDSSDSEDDQPLQKKSKKEPTDAELTKVVKNILKDANLEEVTMKTVCKQVYDQFPEFDLTSRKDFIKKSVKETIS